MTIFPKFDRVLIRRDTLQAKGSNIIIPQAAAQANLSERGTVIAVGPSAGIRDKDGNILETIEVGARVIFAIHAGVAVKNGTDDKDSLWLCQDNDILAEIKE